MSIDELLVSVNVVCCPVDVLLTNCQSELSSVCGQLFSYTLLSLLMKEGAIVSQCLNFARIIQSCRRGCLAREAQCQCCWLSLEMSPWLTSFNRRIQKRRLEWFGAQHSFKYTELETWSCRNIYIFCRSFWETILTWGRLKVKEIPKDLKMQATSIMLWVHLKWVELFELNDMLPWRLVETWRQLPCSTKPSWRRLSILLWRGRTSGNQ